jgi:hypothetical protein
MVVRARLSRRSPPRLSLCRSVFPDDAGIGQVPASAANAASDRTRPGCDHAVSTHAATRPVTGHDSRQRVGQASNQATEARPGRCRRHDPAGQIPGRAPTTGPHRSRVTRSQTATPILSASTGPATTNTYRRFKEGQSGHDYETILVERDDRVATITLNRPKALNALNAQVMNEVTTAAAEFDNDPEIGVIIITGSPKAFAAGADIKEMADLSFADAFGEDYFATWAKLAAVRTPTIAAVAGYALGGGCELAMMCDLLIAADTAKFGQPEIKLGVLPGMGGSHV